MGEDKANTYRQSTRNRSITEIFSSLLGASEPERGKRKLKALFY